MMPTSAGFFMKMFNQMGFSLPEMMIITAVIGDRESYCLAEFSDHYGPT
jgi:Tfp pilus assembly protein FimT